MVKGTAVAALLLALALAVGPAGCKPSENARKAEMSREVGGEATPSVQEYTRLQRERVEARLREELASLDEQIGKLSEGLDDQSDEALRERVKQLGEQSAQARDQLRALAATGDERWSEARKQVERLIETMRGELGAASGEEPA